MKKHLVILTAVLGLVIGYNIPQKASVVEQNSGICEQALPVAGISRINLIALETISLDTTVEVQKNEVYEVTLPSTPYQGIIDSLSDEEKKLLYSVVAAEADNQGLDGQRAVIEVIFNRMLHEDFPDTLEGVLSQSGQFLGYKVKKEGGDAQEEALELVYTKKPILSTEYLYFSKGKFSWADNYVKIEDHWFGTR